MDVIAKSAGVSVKTIYSHFSNKDELFSKVMIGACTDSLFAGDIPSEDVLKKRFAWFSKAPQQGLFEAGKEYLGHLLSAGMNWRFIAQSPAMPTASRSLDGSINRLSHGAGQAS